MPLLPTLLTRVVGGAAALFQEIERTGPPIPDGPVLVAANHLNSLLDPLVLFHTAGRPTRPLAKAPLFTHPFIGPFLKGLGGLPVYRRQDDPTQMDRNQNTFDAAVAALHRGEAVQIYPEGLSHSEPGLAPLKTGVARIALLAEERAEWRLGLVIVPVGITYQRKHLFRGRAVAAVGTPIAVADWRARYEADADAAVGELTDAVRAGLERVTLNFVEAGDRELVEVAEALHARAKGSAEWTEHPGLAERWPRLRAFTEGLAWLRAHDPERHRRLARKVRRYAQLAALLGAGEWGVPRRYRWSTVVGYGLRALLLLAILTPLALLGLVAWLIPYWIPTLVVRLVRPDLEAIATYKLSTAFLAFPLFLALWVALGWMLGGPLRGALAGILAVIGGLAWIAWRARLRVLGDDLQGLLRSLPRARSRDRLAALRGELSREFDEIAERAHISATPA
jgi:glycerol-3-phosphate O-acyltransferase/dihydroxyacetone phosphate acyltransferase